MSDFDNIANMCTNVNVILRQYTPLYHKHDIMINGNEVDIGNVLYDDIVFGTHNNNFR